MKKLFLIASFVSASLNLLHADVTTLNFDTGSFSIKNSNDASVLTGGTASAGDGTVVQLGYYSTATSGNNFSGNWVPITGAGSLNTAFNNSTLGDLDGNGAGDGTFANSFSFNTDTAATVVALPVNGAILAVRFYNGTTLVNSTHFAAASNNLWTWISPISTPSTINMSLDDGVVWQGGFTAYTGNLLTAIPEPSTYASLAGLAILGFAAMRRRRA